MEKVRVMESMSSTNCKKRVENLMDRILNCINNQAVEFHNLADKAEKRALTEFEAELIRNMAQVYKSLVKQRFLEEISGICREDAS